MRYLEALKASTSSLQMTLNTSCPKIYTYTFMMSDLMIQSNLSNFLLHNFKPLPKLTKNSISIFSFTKSMLTIFIMKKRLKTQLLFLNKISKPLSKKQFATQNGLKNTISKKQAYMTLVSSQVALLALSDVV